MKNSRFRILVMVALFVMAGIGISQRNTYTNIADTTGSLNSFLVAEMPESIALSVSESMREILPQSEFVLRIRVLDRIDPQFKINRQLVEVVKVFQGEGVEQGEIIYITTPAWRFFFDDMTANRGFINELEVEGEYLIFLSGKVDALRQETVPTYWLEETIITPCFSYTLQENIVIPVKDEYTYVEYEYVRDNEFFASTQMALDAMVELKMYLLDIYR